MKKLLILVSLGIIGTMAVLKGVRPKKDVLHFVEPEQDDRNFGAFPVDIPENQFDALFV